MKGTSLNSCCYAGRRHQGRKHYASMSGRFSEVTRPRPQLGSRKIIYEPTDCRGRRPDILGLIVLELQIPMGSRDGRAWSSA